VNSELRGAVAAFVLLCTPGLSLADDASHAASVERGRYLIITAGCNDCHTANYAPSLGQVPESEWLLGDALGWRGPWGTTYPANLRLSLSTKTEDQWVVFAQNMQTRPPMPWYDVSQMTEEDLRSIYRYVRQMQPIGEAVPDYVPPDVVPNPPFVQFP